MVPGERNLLPGLRFGVAFADAGAGEERLVRLRKGRIALTLAWLGERDLSGELLRIGPSLTAGTRRGVLGAMVENAELTGDIERLFDVRADVASAMGPTWMARWSMPLVLWAGTPVEGRGGKGLCPIIRRKKGDVQLQRQRHIARAAATGVEALKRELGRIDPKIRIRPYALPKRRVLPRRIARGGQLVPMGLPDITCGAGCAECF
jgi:hypothetical protein